MLSTVCVKNKKHWPGFQRSFSVDLTILLVTVTAKLNISLTGNIEVFWTTAKICRFRLCVPVFHSHPLGNRTIYI